MAARSNTPSVEGEGHGSAIAYIVAAFTGIAWFNSIELILLVLVTFKSYKGLYFWSLTISSLAVIPYQLGFLMFFFQLTSNNYVSMAIVNVSEALKRTEDAPSRLTMAKIGWAPMVTGQAVVLYSRLHLVTQNTNILKRIKYMIAFNAILFHPPTIVISFLALCVPGGGSPAEKTAYSVVEKVQMSAFCIQEFIISAIYLRETVRLMKMSFREKSQRVMWQLIWINVFIIVIDLVLLGIEYASLYTLETTLKGVVYSVKLLLEYAVLSRLVTFTTTSTETHLTTSKSGEGGDFDQDHESAGFDDFQTSAIAADHSTMEESVQISNNSTRSSEELGKASLDSVESGHNLEGVATDASRSPSHNLSLRPASHSKEDLWIQDFAYR